MKLRKVISGGQTGADQQGVVSAHALGLETGGTMPKGFKTENGPVPDWAKHYGLIEDSSSDYTPRTYKNVLDADVTVWFGNTSSPGYRCTRRAADTYDRPFYSNPDTDVFLFLAETYEVMNVAGNRASKNPKVSEMVRTTFEWLIK